MGKEKESSDVVQGSRLFSFLKPEEKRQIAIESVPRPPVVQPWEQVVGVLQKCYRCVQRRNYAFAEIYYEELRPFYVKLTPPQQQLVYPYLVELQQVLVMARFKKVKALLRRQR